MNNNLFKYFWIIGPVYFVLCAVQSGSRVRLKHFARDFWNENLQATHSRDLIRTWPENVNSEPSQPSERAYSNENHEEIS